MKNYHIIFLLVALLAGSCTDEGALRKAAATITADELRNYTMTLAADSFMGRKPFSPGEAVTVRYLAGELEKIGFRPAFGESWFQSVPMTEISTRVNGPVTITAGGDRLEFTAPDDVAIESPSQKEIIEIKDMPMVFCGFGIVAPEYGWDDYRNSDVKGKCVVVLINDPGLYTGDTPPCDVCGWLNADAADRLFSALGYSVDTLRREACRKDWHGFGMAAAINVKLENTHTHNTSLNVAGILPGTKNPDECVVIEGHWDHFGIGEAENGDSIYNGAVDNGTTMAWAFEIGEAFASLSKKPERSVILLFPTAEEQGLLGSSWFTVHPTVAPENIIACFNNDMMLAIGRMNDIMVTGYGQSELEDMLAQAAEKQGRYILPDPTPETGMYFLSDHFPFALIGVPSLFARGNCDSREHGKEWAATQEKEYLTTMYHKPADNYYPSMNFEGIAEDARAAFEVAWRIVTSDIRPQWKAGSEFANIRPAVH
jgi:hypothetical protein